MSSSNPYPPPPTTTTMAAPPAASSSSSATGLIPDLPDDLAVRCIARLPRSQHPALSLVSRSWCAVLRSPLLLAVRSDLGLSDAHLCLNLVFPSSDSRWFLLEPHRRSPTPVPIPPTPLAAGGGSACAALGACLFVLGGSVNGVPSPAVQVFDARRGRWSLGPRMSAGREFAAASALGGRIYAIGGCLPPPDAWAEAFVPADACGRGRWEVVPSPPQIREKWMHGCVVLGGKILAVADRGGVVYDPETTVAGEKWGSVPAALDNGWKGRAAVVGGILYSYDYLGKIRGYDPEADVWKQLEGVEKKLPKFLCGATLANLGGLLCLVWEGKGKGSGIKEMVVEWAGIDVSRTSDGRLQGCILWSEPITFPAPKGSSIAHCVALEI